MNIPLQPDLTTPQKWYRNQYLILFLTWLVVTLLNINKAFHIDDTFHLEAAKWIMHHPLRPMSGMVNWYDDPEPFGNPNQPPLYFYLIALWGKAFGFSEIILHLMQSIFTFLCIHFFFKIAKLFNEKDALALTVLFAFNPAFIVNQNLMKDIPLLSFLLAFTYTLIKPDSKSDTRRYVTASTILATGLLIKYSLLPMIPVLALTIIYHKKYRYLLVLLIPVLFLSLWSVWNYYDFGSVHLLHRGSGASYQMMVQKGNSLIICLGAISFFSLFILPGIFPSSRALSVIAIVACLAIPVFAVLVYCGIIPERDSTDIIGTVFTINGSLVLLSIGYLLFVYFFNTKIPLPVKRRIVIIFFWIAAVVSFIIGYAPFIATRHVLLILPAVLIILSVLWEKAPAYVRNVTLAGTIISGVVLGVSDWQFADFYRNAAANIKTHVTGGKLWSVGHWGWQWYCNRNGMETFGTNTSGVNEGDYLVIPNHLPKQDFHRLNLTKVKSVTYAPNILSFFSVSLHAGFYATSPNEIPWYFSRIPIDTVVVYRVNKELNKAQ